MKTAQNDFAAVESPHRGADLLRKLMDAALNAERMRRYRSLRSAWVRAMCNRANETRRN